MIQVTPQMRILLAVEPADFRKGIDGLAQVCRQVLRSLPLYGSSPRLWGTRLEIRSSF